MVKLSKYQREIINLLKNGSYIVWHKSIYPYCVIYPENKIIRINTVIKLLELGIVKVNKDTYAYKVIKYDKKNNN